MTIPAFEVRPVLEPYNADFTFTVASSSSSSEGSSAGD
jgi:hypothetical protein